MPAKPQHMSENQDKSDDLIAELAKLMATNAKGGEDEARPSVIKLTPLSEATVPPPAPVRIPGMEMPKPEPKLDAPSRESTPPAEPTVSSGASQSAPSSTPAESSTSIPPSPGPVRIPGMEKPAIAVAPAAPPLAVVPPAAAAASAPANAAPPRSSLSSTLPTGPADFSRLSAAGTPPPAKPAAPLPGAVSADFPQVTPPISAKTEPHSTPKAPETSAAPEGDSFDFDFGFGAQHPSGQGADSPSIREIAQAEDPIADLIAAELDASEQTTDAAKPAAAPSVFPASVKAIPARSFGNPAAAGQVLVARPAASRPEPAPESRAKALPPSSQPPQSDRFAVAPVFGLGGKPATPTTPSVDPSAVAPAVAAPPAAPQAPKPPRSDDPMDEIESLIGDAVRTSMAAQPTRAESENRQQAAPVVPPLTTGFAPRRAGLKDNEPPMESADSADAAILAAAAASGADVDRIELDDPNQRADDGRRHRRMRVKPPGTRSFFGGPRQYVGLAVAGTLLLAAGFGLYWVLGMGPSDPSSAPVLSADATPAKQDPVTVPSATAPVRSVVFDEISGVSANAGGETLVSRDETADATVAEVARVETPAGADSSESGLANRKVRTVTVRPDGTIVSGDDTVAGGEALPVDRPNVPELPGGAVQPSELLTASAAGSGETATGQDQIAALVSGGAGDAPAENVELAALAPPAGESVNPSIVVPGLQAPIPMPRPADRSALASAGSTSAPVASTAAVTPNAPASTPLVAVTQPAASTGSNAAAYVQLSSQRTEADAQASLRSVQSRWGNLFQGGSLEIQRADLGQRGIYYRVRLPASSLQSANQICASIKSNGGDCFATGS
jgi:hypothetical protein